MLYDKKKNSYNSLDTAISLEEKYTVHYDYSKISTSNLIKNGSVEINNTESAIEIIDENNPYGYFTINAKYAAEEGYKIYGRDAISPSAMMFSINIKDDVSGLMYYNIKSFGLLYSDFPTFPVEGVDSVSIEYTLIPNATNLLELIKKTGSINYEFTIDFSNVKLIGVNTGLENPSTPIG